MFSGAPWTAPSPRSIPTVGLIAGFVYDGKMGQQAASRQPDGRIERSAALRGPRLTLHIPQIAASLGGTGCNFLGYTISDGYVWVCRPLTIDANRRHGASTSAAGT